jgi:hypothetical protein
MDQLQPGIESELGRHDRQREVVGEGRIEPRPDLGLEAEHAAGKPTVPAGEVLEVALELSDVALEPGPQREVAGHLLGEERRAGGLAAVDRRRAPEHDPLQGRGPLAGREQLQGADHVDVVERARRLTGLRIPEDAGVDEGVHPGRGQQTRQQRAADVGFEELGPPELHQRRRRIDADHLLDPVVTFEAERQLGPPVGSDSGDQYASPWCHSATYASESR